MPRIKKVCKECGGDDVYAETTAYWDVILQSWEISDGNGAFDDNAFCNTCMCDVTLEHEEI